MANFELPNDKVATITILTRDEAGDIVPALAGDVFSVASSNPESLEATIGADAQGAPAVVLKPLVATAAGLSITVSDSDGLQAFTQDVDIVANTTPKALGLDIGNAVETDQPVPAGA